MKRASAAICAAFMILTLLTAYAGKTNAEIETPQDLTAETADETEKIENDENEEDFVMGSEQVKFYLTKNNPKTVDDTTMFVEQPPLVLGNKGEGIFVDITVNEELTFQQIDGFGASFTDSSAYLINRKLSPDARGEAMTRLFSPSEGIGLSFLRQPMGSSDFARTVYSFDDMPDGETDFELENFSIDHDREDIIPLMKQALALNPDILFMSSPWSPPGWMKTSGSMIGGSLRKDCYDVYARYFLKYIQAYAEEGLDIYAVTPQNEPLYVPGHYPGCGWTAGEQARFIRDGLGKTLRDNGIKTKIFTYDHNWDVTDFAETVESLASEYTDAVAWHWYGGSAESQTEMFDRLGKDVYFTEGSGGEWIPPFEAAFMTFMTQGINIMNNRSRSLVFWNLALDEENGPVVPGFGRSTCRGVLTVDQQTGALTYNLDYYALAHFSKFIRPGAVRVACEGKGKLYAFAAKNPDGSTVIVAANDDTGLKPVRFNLRGLSFSLEMPGKSAATFVIE